MGGMGESTDIFLLKTPSPEERTEVTNRPDVPVLTLRVRFGPNHGLEKSSPDLPAFPCWFRAGVSRAS